MGAMSEREQLRRVRCFLPPHVMSLITTRSEAELLAFEQREITVVFCDLRGFTAFAHTAASAEIVDVLGAYHRGVGPLIVEAGGILERFTGDGLMVYFDGPPVREQALGAIVMALQMRDVAGELASGWRRRGHHLSLGIGIALGQATLGPIGFEQRRDFAAIGPVTNLASRLCADASAGQILMEERLYSDLHDVLEAEPLGARWLKGFTAAVNVYSVRAVATKRTLTAPRRPAEAASQWH
jgi:class 3 adenylate cyclase